MGETAEDLSGRVAIVTGSTSGIGAATARRLAAAGAHIVVNSSSPVDAGEALAESLPSESIYVQTSRTNSKTWILLHHQHVPDGCGRRCRRRVDADDLNRVLTKRPASLTMTAGLFAR